MKSIIILMFFLPVAVFGFCRMNVIQKGENEDCYLAWLKDSQGHLFVLKQIKDPDPSEQFLLVVDAAANQIGSKLDLPVNQVVMIPAGEPFPGKRMRNYPATLHSLVPGKSTEERPPWKGFTIHQRNRPLGSWMEKKWGPLPQNQKGLTSEVIGHLLARTDLQKIAALDTFVGNSDRSCPNVFYSVENDQFYGIDMAASFGSPLAHIACDQLARNSLESSLKSMLRVYRETLEQLYEKVPPEEVAGLLDFLASEAGFNHQVYLKDIGVEQRSRFHKSVFQANYQLIPKLLKLLEE